MSDEVITRDENGDLAVRTVAAMAADSNCQYDDLYVRTTDGKRALRVVGSGGVAGGAVESVNGKTGAVILTGANINATLTDGDASETATVTQHLQTLKNDGKEKGDTIQGIQELIPANASAANQLATSAGVVLKTDIYSTAAGQSYTATNKVPSSSVLKEYVASPTHAEMSFASLAAGQTILISGLINTSYMSNLPGGCHGVAIVTDTSTADNAKHALIVEFSGIGYRGYGKDKASIHAKVLQNDFPVPLEVKISNADTSELAITPKDGGSISTRFCVGVLALTGRGSYRPLTISTYQTSFLDLQDVPPFIDGSKAHVLPTASNEYLGVIFQYVGETTADYTNGYFYKCTSDGAETPTYSWQAINVQSDVWESISVHKINNGADITVPPTGGTMVVATPPTAAGNYVLKATVVEDGTVTTTWVAE